MSVVMGENCSMYCSNLSERVKEDILFELASQVGPVDSVNIVSNSSRGYGFVIFKHPESVSYAVKVLAGVRLYGKTVFWAAAQPSVPTVQDSTEITPLLPCTPKTPPSQMPLVPPLPLFPQRIPSLFNFSFRPPMLRSDFAKFRKAPYNKGSHDFGRNRRQNNSERNRASDDRNYQKDSRDCHRSKTGDSDRIRSGSNSSDRRRDDNRLHKIRGDTSSSRQ